MLRRTTEGPHYASLPRVYDRGQLSVRLAQTRDAVPGRSDRNFAHNSNVSRTSAAPSCTAPWGLDTYAQHPPGFFHDSNVLQQVEGSVGVALTLSDQPFNSGLGGLD